MDGYSGDAGDAIRMPQAPQWIVNGMMFGTPDSDNDAWLEGNCADSSGWWSNRCAVSNLNLDDSIWTTGSAVFDVQASHVLVKFH